MMKSKKVYVPLTLAQAHQKVVDQTRLVAAMHFGDPRLADATDLLQLMKRNVAALAPNAATFD